MVKWLLFMGSFYLPFELLCRKKRSTYIACIRDVLIKKNSSTVRTFQSNIIKWSSSCHRFIPSSVVLRDSISSSSIKNLLFAFIGKIRKESVFWWNLAPLISFVNSTLHSTQILKTHKKDHSIHDRLTMIYMHKFFIIIIKNSFIQRFVWISHFSILDLDTYILINHLE